MKTPRTQRAAGEDAAAGPRRRPTINDIARIAGVSKKTVSRVINKSPFVRGDTRDRIEAVIKELDFAPDLQARGLAFRRSFLIGLAYDNPNPQYVVNMQLGLLDGMRGTGFELVVHPCDRASPTFLDDLRGFVERQRLFGVALTPSISEDERAAALLAEIGCRYVRVASVALEAAEHMIETRDRLGGLAAARHLVALGHTRFGLISGPPTFRSSHERRGGFEDGLREAGHALAPAWTLEGAYTYQSGLARGRELLNRPDRPTAIFALNDEMAAGVLQAAREAQIAVPGDLSVVGYDDFSVAAQVWPALTTVRTPTREMGRLAALRLLGEPEPPATDPNARIPTLVVRDSSGPPP